VTTPTTAELAARGLRLDIDDAVATVTLSRPERRNAMTPGMWHGLAMVGASLPARVRVVVVRGAGPSFSAGIDLRMFSGEGVPGEEPVPSAAEPGFEDWIASVQAGYTWLREPAVVSVAAVQGHAIGAGFQLALACDLRVLADDARLCIKEPALGLVPDLTGTKPLVEIVGLPRAIELCLTARTLDAAEAEVSTIIEERHKIKDTSEPGFSVLNQGSLLETSSSTSSVFTTLLGEVAAISLLVGGIGVMNIMLVSVTERIREIGLRKALGATPRLIRRQFLVEASLLGLAGGVLGAGVGLAGAVVLPHLLSNAIAISPAATIGAIAVAMLIGLVFGVYPAGRAARLAPIDALRTE